MKELGQILRQNRKASVFICSAIGFLLLAATLSACSIEDMIDFDVPPKVAKAIDVEESEPVSRASQVWDDWQVYVERESARLADSIDDAQRSVGLLRSLSDTGLALGQSAASTLPGGALISSGLALMGGLFLKRPGTDKQVSKEKEKSYQAGIEEGQKLAAQVASTISAAGLGVDIRKK